MRTWLILGTGPPGPGREEGEASTRSYSELGRRRVALPNVGQEIFSIGKA